MTAADAPRYAVYFALPRDSALWLLAQRWLGRDCETGAALRPPALDGWSAGRIAEVTASPRRYGFHATLKAPFHLAPGVSLRQLHDCLGAFAAGQRPFVAPPLEVSAIGPFLALTLSAPCPEMDALAAAAVKHFDPLRAPLTEDELARRLDSGLTPRQRELLRRWGYPYVMEEFRFHMTLTGPIGDAAARQDLQTRLAGLFRPVLAAAVPVREVSLYRQETRATPFTLLERIAFARAPAVPGAAGRLVLVVGPSGAGKDSLIDAARKALAGQPRFVFARRLVTRPSSPESEDHDSLSAADFAARQAAGAFFLHWDAHGLSYALPGSIADDLAAGRTVIANVSRDVIEQARRRHPATTVVCVTAPPEVLEQRLLARGREDAGGVRDRLARSAAQPAGSGVFTIVNDGPLDTAVATFLAALGTRTDA